MFMSIECCQISIANSSLQFFVAVWLRSEFCDLLFLQEQYWQQAFIGSLNNASLRNHLFHLTKEPHLAGTPEDFATAEYVFQRFQEYGLSAHYTDYDVLLSYPLHRSLILSVPTKEPLTLSLEEKPVEGDPYSSNPKVTPTFHGYAPSGNVSAEVVYANYGRVEDFQKLVELGINVKDAIVIAKYGSIYRGDIVENAAQAGAVAVIIYSDPQDYAANNTEGVYPDSKWLPPSGTQRGSIYRGIGDPLTPNWPSTPDAERISVSDPEAMLPTIPSLPISAEDALPILASLSGPVSPANWHGALDLPQYRVGRGPGVLNLSFCVSCLLAMYFCSMWLRRWCVNGYICELILASSCVISFHHVCAFKQCSYSVLIGKF
jgi:N-acetylated-alpha-linked acidic dipeptidase